MLHKIFFIVSYISLFSCNRPESKISIDSISLYSMDSLYSFIKKQPLPFPNDPYFINVTLTKTRNNVFLTMLPVYWQETLKKDGVPFNLLIDKKHTFLFYCGLEMFKNPNEAMVKEQRRKIDSLSEVHNITTSGGKVIEFEPLIFHISGDKIVPNDDVETYKILFGIKEEMPIVDSTK